jgi:SOS-response transcriptional repressor LexA
MKVINDYIGMTGYPPSVKVIVKIVNLPENKVRRYLEDLKKKGFITWEKGALGL